MNACRTFAQRVVSAATNLGVGGVSTLRDPWNPLLNLRRFGLMFKTQIMTIHHYKMSCPQGNSGQSLNILTLAFAFCNITNMYWTEPGSKSV